MFVLRTEFWSSLSDGTRYFQDLEGALRLVSARDVYYSRGPLLGHCSAKSVCSVTQLDFCLYFCLFHSCPIFIVEMIVFCG